MEEYSAEVYLPNHVLEILNKHKHSFTACSTPQDEQLMATRNYFMACLMNLSTAPQMSQNGNNQERTKKPNPILFAIEDISERKHHSSLTQIAETTKQEDWVLDACHLDFEASG